MTDEMPVIEGEARVPGGLVHFRRINPGAGTPLLVVHGGPGAGSRYLRRLTGLAATRELVFYDQLGSGRSTTIDGDPAWNIERSVSEIKHLRDFLGLTTIDIFGHSFGSWLTVEYLSTQAPGVRSVILANGAASAADFSSGVAQCVTQLSAKSRQTLARYANNPWSRDREYVEALAEFYVNHIVATHDQALKLLDIQQASPEYRAMMGPHELCLTGNLLGWDRRGGLGTIDVPTLVLAGRRDHNTPECAKVLADGIANSEFVVFEDSAHSPFDEERERFLAIVEKFLREIDLQSPLALSHDQ
ncbi:proline iminopeptidase-family hydrolase [Rhodococcus koreensis]